MRGRSDPLWGVGALLGIMGLLVAAWSVRQPPGEPNDCLTGGPTAVREAWLSGLEPAGFVAACACAGVVVWASRSRTNSTVLASVALVLGAAWWIGGEASPVSWWAIVAWLTLFPSVLVVPGLIAAVWWTVSRGRERWAWRWLKVLGWWTLLLLVPAFVVEISLAGQRFYC